MDAIRSAFSAVIEFDIWEDGESQQEIAFRQALKKLRPKMEEMYEKGNYAGVVLAGEELELGELGGYLKSSHPHWAQAEYFRWHIHTVQILRFFSHANLIDLRQWGSEAYSYKNLISAYLLLEDVVSIPPFSMNGPSDSEMAPQDAAIANLNYRDALKAARKFMDNAPLDLLPESDIKSFNLTNPQIKVAAREVGIWEKLNNFSGLD